MAGGTGHQEITAYLSTEHHVPTVIILSDNMLPLARLIKIVLLRRYALYDNSFIEVTLDICHRIQTNSLIIDFIFTMLQDHQLIK